MLEIYPSYYEQFRCIADRCEDTCCAGWEIDIDDASYEAYMRVEGELGTRLRACIKSYESEDDYDEAYEQHGFILTEDMRCPFLDEKNLCDLYRELGEESLCEVCTNTPRNFLEYRTTSPDGSKNRSVREIQISASCPEAARLIYGSQEKIMFLSREVSDKPDIEDDEDEALLGSFLIRVRDEAIAILQNRDQKLSERIRRFLLHAEAVQEAINRWESGEADLPEALSPTEFNLTVEPVDSYEHFLIRMGTYSGLASIGTPWKESMELLYESFVENPEGKATYLKSSDNLFKYLSEKGRLYEYEHLLVYYTFLLLNRCIDDYDYLGKAKLVVLSYHMNHDMDAGVFLKKESLTKEERMANARIYAREVEHADENLADLAEEILFERAYDTNTLINLI